MKDDFAEAAKQIKGKMADLTKAVGPAKEVPGKIAELLKSARDKIQTLQDTKALEPALKLSSRMQQTAERGNNLAKESSKLFTNDVQRLASFFYADAFTKAKQGGSTVAIELAKGIQAIRAGTPKDLGQMERAYRYAKDVMGGEQKDFIIHKLGDHLKEYGEMAKEHGYFKGKEDGEFGNIDIEKTANGYLPRHVANKDGSRTGSFKGRKYDTIFDLMASGNTLETKDPGEAASRYMNRVEGLIAKPKMAQEALMTKSADGKPNALIVRSHKIKEGILRSEPEAVVTENEIVDGHDSYIDDDGKTWANPKDIIRGVPIRVENADGTHEYHMADIALNHRLNNTYKREGSRSGVKEWYDKPSGSTLEAMGKIAVKVADKALNTPAKIASLAFSLFHATTVGAQGAIHGFNPFRLREVDMNPESAKVKDYLDHSANLFDEKGEQEYRDGVGLSNLAGKNSPLMKALNLPGKFTFEYLLPRLKVKLYEAQETRMMKQFGWKEAGVDADGLKKWEPVDASKPRKYTVDDVKHFLWTTVNDELGHRNNRVMGTNRTAQHLTSMLLFAPDFNIGRLATMVNAARGLTGPAGREQTAVLALSAAAGYVAARALNAILNDGDSKPDHPFSLVVNGHEYTLRTMPNDIIKMFSDPSSWAASRLSPVMNLAKEEVLQRNWKGEKIDHTEGLKNFGLGFIPMVARDLPVMSDITQPGKGGSPSIIDSALGFLGIHSLDAGPLKEIKSAARRWESANGVENKGAYAESRYKAMKNALDIGDREMAKEAFNHLVEAQHKLDPKIPLTDVKGRIIAGLKDSLDRHFTDSIEHDKAFIKSLDPNHKRAYNEAKHQLSRMWDMAKSVTGTGSGTLKIIQR